MISIYAFSLFLWICLSVLASAQGGVTKITKVSRTRNGHNFKLTIEYEGDLQTSDIHCADETVKIGDPDNGKVEIEVDKRKHNFGISIYLGNLRSHFVKLGWQLRGDDARSMTLNYVLSAVNPGTDVVIYPGEENKVTISTESDTRGGDLEVSTSEIDVYGDYMENGQVVRRDDIAFIKKSQSTEGTKKETVLSFTPQTVPGYYYWTPVRVAKNVNTATVTQVMEYIILTAHRKRQNVPFGLTFAMDE